MTSLLSPVQAPRSYPTDRGATPDFTPAAMLGGGARGETSSPAPSGRGVRLVFVRSGGGVRYAGIALELGADADRLVPWLRLLGAPRGGR